MIKYSFLLLNMLALFIVKLFMSGDVNVKVTAPVAARAGEEILVTITIDKGSIAGVGHMKQELPVNFQNATVVEAKGADFKYLPEDNVVKFTWISLPPDQSFSISYKVSIKKDAAPGTVDLAGKFSYVLNNEKQTFEVPPAKIQVGDEFISSAQQGPEKPADEPAEEPTSEPSTQPDEQPADEPAQEEPAAETKEEPVVAQNQPEPEPEAPAPDEKTTFPVTSKRTIIGSPEAGTEFTVEIVVQKKGIKGFARILETLPDGFSAKALENKGGTFSFIEQKMKIIWDNLPEDEVLMISYRVYVDENAKGEFDINGSFSYVENDDPKKAFIPATKINVKAKEVLASTPDQTPDETPDEAPANTGNEGGNQQEPVKEEPVVASTIPGPEKDVAFKVQICALSRLSRTGGYFENKYSIANTVAMEYHEGWRKYIVGKYSQYKEARDYRESMRANGVENPFVTAYNLGKRITVQEALMVSNQKWVP